MRHIRWRRRPPKRKRQRRAAQAIPRPCRKRARLIAELNASPGTRENLIRLAKAEWGSDPEQVQAGIESILNRAAMRNESVAQAIDARYHSPSRGRGGVGGLPMPKDTAVYERAIKEAEKGGNVSDYSTGNFAYAGRGYGGKGGYGTRLIGSEQFSVQAADAAKIAAVKAADEALRKKAAAAPAKKGFFATEEEEQRNEGKGPNYPGQEIIKKAEAVTQQQTKIFKQEGRRDPFGVQLLHPSFQPKPEPPPKALKFSMLEDAMMHDPRRQGINRMMRDMNMQQRVGGATGGQSVAMNGTTINVNGVAPGREVLMAKKTALAMRDPLEHGLAQLKAMRAHETRLSYT